MSLFIRRVVISDGAVESPRSHPLRLSDQHAVVRHASCTITCAPCWAALCEGIRTQALPHTLPGAADYPQPRRVRARFALASTSSQSSID